MKPSTTALSRRRFHQTAAALVVAPLAACSTPLPLLGSAPAASNSPAHPARARLLESAQAHGLAAYQGLSDINVAYAGQWRPLIGRVQLQVVDAGYRGPSEERLLPALGINAQAFRGPSGRKQVFWRRGTGEVAVWFNGRASTDDGERSAAAVVAECYGLFLLGPLWLADRRLPLEMSGTERVHGRLCDVVDAWLSPGLGRSALDRVSLCIDRDDAITRRVRFTLEGYAGTRGAVAETDTFEHRRLFGVLWPMRSYEEVVHPLRLPAHDWFITGLDVNRGYGSDAVSGPVFSSAAAAPAAALPSSASG